MARLTKRELETLFGYPIEVATEYQQDLWEREMRNLRAVREFVCKACKAGTLHDIETNPDDPPYWTECVAHLMRDAELSLGCVTVEVIRVEPTKIFYRATRKAQKEPPS